MTKAKNAVFIGLQLENCCLVGGGWLLVGGIKFWLGESTVEGIFLAAGRGEANFWLVEGFLSSFPPAGKTLSNSAMKPTVHLFTESMPFCQP